MPDDRGRPYVYLAGPDVFYPDAHKRAERMKQALAQRGMAGLFPLDNALCTEDFPDVKALALGIARANEAMMRAADMGIANISPWRGTEADDGTAYEIGFMAALGKPVVLYTTDPRPFAQRVAEDYYGGAVRRDGALLRGASDGMMVEDFEGFADNLMLVNAAVAAAERVTGSAPDPAGVVQPGFEAAADSAMRLWRARRQV